MIDSALFQALKSKGQMGAPSVQSEAPLAPGPVTPSAGPGSPLFSALNPEPQQPMMLADNADTSQQTANDYYKMAEELRKQSEGPQEKEPSLWDMFKVKAKQPRAVESALIIDDMRKHPQREQ